MHKSVHAPAARSAALARQVVGIASDSDTGCSGAPTASGAASAPLREPSRQPPQCWLGQVCPSCGWAGRLPVYQCALCRPTACQSTPTWGLGRHGCAACIVPRCCVKPGVRFRHSQKVAFPHWKSGCVVHPKNGFPPPARGRNSTPPLLHPATVRCLLPQCPTGASDQPCVPCKHVLLQHLPCGLPRGASMTLVGLLRQLGSQMTSEM